MSTFAPYPTSPAYDSWLYDEPIQLRDDVEIITGAGGRTLLVSGSGKFLHVSSSGLLIVRTLGDGLTGVQVIEHLTRTHPHQAAGIVEVVPRFLNDLRKASVLTLEPQESLDTGRVTELGRVDPVKRFPLISEPDRFTAPIAERLRRLPATAFCALLLALPLAGLGLVIASFLGSRADFHPTVTLAVGAVAAMVVEIALHESCHAVAMAYNRVRARNAGVGLLFYLLPIAYVDRTDSYRHRGRFGRVMISLVGPLWDLTLAGVSAAVVMNTSGDVATFFRLLLLLQLFSVLANLNPLFPSDGYHALEAAVGSINMRARAITYVLYRLASKPLPLYLEHLRTRTKVGYFCYAIVSVLYTLAVIVGTLANLVAIVVKVV